ncbi:MAG: hypothetical protein ACXVB1_14630 [Pseudobdellovibrionaceae bacterium]
MKTDVELKDEILEWPSAHVIMAHGPAKGLRDWNGHNNCGSESYRWKLERLQESKTRIFMSGHIHEAYGFGQFNNIAIISAAVTGIYNSPVYPEPINFEIYFDETTSIVTKVIIVKDWQNNFHD